jgi:hypothetical protein
MKTSSEAGHHFRVLLPLIMTGVQLGLLAASLVIHREPWVLPDLPESQAQTQADCSGEDCTVSFSPMPPEPRAGRFLKIAMVLNLPAVFLGAVLHIVAVLIHFPDTSGEPTLLGFSAVFVPVIWYRVGRWLDDLVISGIAAESTKFNAKAVWRMVTRAIVWFLLVLMLLSLLVERHRETDTTMFLQVISILWTGAYLAGGFLGDRRIAARLRAPVS